MCFTESKALMLLLYMQGYKISFLKELYRKKSEATSNLAQISPILQAGELTVCRKENCSPVFAALLVTHPSEQHSLAPFTPD